VLSLPKTVFLLSKRDQLKVRVNIVLGPAAPPLTIKLVRLSALIPSQEVEFKPNSTLQNRLVK